MTKLIVINLVSLVSLIFAAILCSKGAEGWGWFLLLSYFSFCYPKSTSKRDEK